MNKYFSYAAILISVSISIAGEVYRDAGAGAFAFLKVDPGARSAALGGTSLLNAPELGVFTNPALLPATDHSCISIGHDRWLGDAILNFMAWKTTAGKINLALGARSMYVGNLEMRESASSEPLTTFSSWDMAFQMAAGVRLGMFDLGSGFKILSQKIWTETSSGIAFDVGITIRPARDLVFAAAVLHAGPGVTMDGEDFRMPATWKTGGRYFISLPPGSFSLSAEVGKPLDNRSFAGTGLEYEPCKWLDLRMGWKFGNEVSDLTTGIGLKAGGWKLDYAFVPADHALGNVHRMTIGRSL